MFEHADGHRDPEGRQPPAPGARAVRARGAGCHARPPERCALRQGRGGRSSARAPRGAGTRGGARQAGQAAHGTCVDRPKVCPAPADVVVAADGRLAGAAAQGQGGAGATERRTVESQVPAHASTRAPQPSACLTGSGSPRSRRCFSASAAAQQQQRGQRGRRRATSNPGQREILTRLQQRGARCRLVGAGLQHRVVGEGAVTGWCTPTTHQHAMPCTCESAAAVAVPPPPSAAWGAPAPITASLTLCTVLCTASAACWSMPLSC